MRRACWAFLIGGALAVATAVSAAPADPGQEALQRAMAEASRLSEEGNNLETEIAKRVPPGPDQLDLARYDRLNREALADLAIASPSLRPALDGRRLASDAGLNSDLVIYRIELSGMARAAALQAYLLRLAALLGARRAQLESLRLEAVGGDSLRFTVLYGMPHLEPVAEESPSTGNIGDVVQWLEGRNARRRLTLKLLDELAASSRLRDLADALAALGRLAAGQGIAVARLESPGPSLRLEGFAFEPSALAGLEERFAAAGFYDVRLLPQPAEGHCHPFTATMRLGRIDRSDSAAEADTLFASAAERCRAPAAPSPGEQR